MGRGMERPSDEECHGINLIELYRCQPKNQTRVAISPIKLHVASQVPNPWHPARTRSHDPPSERHTGHPAACWVRRLAGVKIGRKDRRGASEAAFPRRTVG